MILNKDAREAFNNEDWEIVKEYIEHLEEKQSRLNSIERKLNTLLEKSDTKDFVTTNFGEFFS